MGMGEVLLPRVGADEVGRGRQAPVDATTLAGAARIVEDVREGGEGAVRGYAKRFGERAPGEPLVYGRGAMEAALRALDAADAELLERVAGRIERFAGAQMEAIRGVDVAIPGGRAGHTVEPVGSVGCYAPAGRYALPSSVLMTAVTARVAGCNRVVVASPGAHPVMLAAGAVAGADEFLAVGGAHAVAGLAYGFGGFAPVDMVLGPGNRWVTAGKQLVSGVVGIDMLAGPSELLIVADESAEAAVVAADLLAQAEHDTDARAMLVTTSERLAGEVEAELGRQLAGLATAETARAALANGFVCVVGEADAMVEIADRVAPEHLEVVTADAEGVARRVRNAGGVFIGAGAAEVLGDYGAGPNHTLPTGGSARFSAGLSVVSLVRLRTWMRIDDPAAASGLIEDTRRMARMEGLCAHEAAAAVRLPG